MIQWPHAQLCTGKHKQYSSVPAESLSALGFSQAACKWRIFLQHECIFIFYCIVSDTTKMKWKATSVWEWNMMLQKICCTSYLAVSFCLLSSMLFVVLVMLWVCILVTHLFQVWQWPVWDCWQRLGQMLYKKYTHFKVYLNKLMHMKLMQSYHGQTNARDELLYW